jgi:hypothetical protein
MKTNLRNLLAAAMLGGACLLPGATQAQDLEARVETSHAIAVQGNAALRQIRMELAQLLPPQLDAYRSSVRATWSRTAMVGVVGSATARCAE